MIDHDFMRLRALHYEAQHQRRDVGFRYARLRDHTHKRLRIDLTVEAAFADLEAMAKRVHGECQIARETMATGAAR